MLHLNRFTLLSSWIEARLAADNLKRSPLRSGISVATMIISLAAIFTIAVFVNSVRGSLLAWVDQMVTADLIVSSGARTAGPKNVPLSRGALPGLEAVPGRQDRRSLSAGARQLSRAADRDRILFRRRVRAQCANCRWPRATAQRLCAPWVPAPVS